VQEKTEQSVLRDPVLHRLAEEGLLRSTGHAGFGNGKWMIRAKSYARNVVDYGREAQRFTAPARKS